MSALLAVLLLAGLVALLERTHRRAHALDHAPGRLPSVDDTRARADLAAAPVIGDSSAAAARWSRSASTRSSTRPGASHPGAAA